MFLLVGPLTEQAALRDLRCYASRSVTNSRRSTNKLGTMNTYTSQKMHRLVITGTFFL